MINPSPVSRLHLYSGASEGIPINNFRRSWTISRDFPIPAAAFTEDTTLWIDFGRSDMDSL
jgi:hypothetical protein